MHAPRPTAPELFLDRLAFWCLALQRGASEQVPGAPDGVASAARVLVHDPAFERTVAGEGLPPGLTPGEVADCLVGSLHAVDRCTRQHASIPAPAPVPLAPRRTEFDVTPQHRRYAPAKGAAGVMGSHRVIKPCPR